MSGPTSADSTDSCARAPARDAANRASALHVVFPRDHAQTIEVDDTTELGRISESGRIGLGHATVSRSHATVSWNREKSRHEVVDRGSHNGTWLNGQGLTRQPVPLSDQDILRLGDVLVVYETIQGVSPAGAFEDEQLRQALPGRSVKMTQLRSRLARAAADPSPILLIGETGTGKEACARELHRLSGRPGLFIPLNCAELTETLLESQLFGHEEGAFTGAAKSETGLVRAADRGTLFLDEIGELPRELQPKLLRFVQEGEVRPLGRTRPIPVDVRTIAATQENMRERVELGEFRRDLYARLSLWELRLPAIRERRADTLAWIDILFARWCMRRGVPAEQLPITRELAEGLLLGTWPDNLRGLDRVVHMFAQSAQFGEALSLDSVPKEVLKAATDEKGNSPPPPNDRAELEEILAKVGGTVSAAARYYQRDRRQIYRWFKSFGIQTPKDEG